MSKYCRVKLTCGFCDDELIITLNQRSRHKLTTGWYTRHGNCVGRYLTEREVRKYASASYHYYKARVYDPKKSHKMKSLNNQAHV